MSGNETVRDQALRLPRNERADLVRDLIASLDEGADDDVEQARLDEAERRAQEVRDGAVALEDWPQVRARIASRLRALRG